MSTEPLIAAVELGGTKILAALAQGRKILERARWPTGDDPVSVLHAVEEWLSQHVGGRSIGAVGIASFGPISLDPGHADFGRIVNTTKPGWSGADVRRILSRRWSAPVGFDTDVAGAALAEGLWGAAAGCRTHVYLTIGTGIGGGLVIDGSPFHGRSHPEMGHVRVHRLPGDTFKGICPFHGDCLEGLASGPAIAARAGRAAEHISPDDPIWRDVAADIAELLASLILTISPERIVIGGGVPQGQSALLPLLPQATSDRLAGYVADINAETLTRIIVPPALGDDAGLLGAVALGLAAMPGCA